MMGYNGGWGNMMGWGGFGFGWIFMIIFWILIILGVVALVRYLGGTKQSSTDQDKAPLEILKERYAKGEIDKKEFEEKKKDLA
ncbi:MAG: SHOCT domain-containing protein [Candidatus Daviesbacteria bacterium]|nr:SHOCT domain-containing protein [Candidatus Daviesbacteria bacterium]